MSNNSTALFYHLNQKRQVLFLEKALKNLVPKDGDTKSRRSLFGRSREQRE